MCTTCQNNKIRKNLFIGKIRCLMHIIRKVCIKFEVNEMSDHVVDVDDMGLHSVSDLYAMLQYSFTHVTIVSDGNVNFPE